VGQLRHVLGRLASRIESLFLPSGSFVPPLHLRWSYYRTLRRDGVARFAAAAAGELLSRGLAPHHRVLDVGCGVGPLALGLLPHLTAGRYDGFDVHPEAVAWCQRAITPRHPRFRFRHADLFNTAYNPRGTGRAAEHRFPYDDETFDFAFLGSVCTHLLGAELSHYLGEVARVLRPGGKCVISFYLLDAGSLAGIDAGTSFLPFTHPAGVAGSRVVDPHVPELAVAHPEALVRGLYAASGLVIEEPIRRGRWWDGVAHQQDVITAVKRPAEPAQARNASEGTARPLAGASGL
jgi:SAM-dependent methyltransferase